MHTHAPKLPVAWTSNRVTPYDIWHIAHPLVALSCIVRTRDTLGITVSGCRGSRTCTYGRQEMLLYKRALSASTKGPQGLIWQSAVQWHT